MRTRKQTGTRRPWTAAEVSGLKTLFRAHARGDRKAPSVRSFANRNRRTEGAARQKAFSLGLSMQRAA